MTQHLALAAAGPQERHRRRPWLPIVASLLSGGQAAVAAKHLFHQMPYVDRAWCPYCVTDALTHFATFACTLPGSARALADGRDGAGTRREPHVSSERAR